MNSLSNWSRNRAIRQYRCKLLGALRKDYGKSEHYSIMQLEATLKRTRLNSSHTIYAFAMFCTPDVFASYFDQQITDQTYEHVRTIIADVEFDGNVKFKQADMSTGGSTAGKGSPQYGPYDGDVGSGGDGGSGGGE